MNSAAASSTVTQRPLENFDIPSKDIETSSIAIVGDINSQGIDRYPKELATAIQAGIARLTGQKPPETQVLPGDVLWHNTDFGHLREALMSSDESAYLAAKQEICEVVEELVEKGAEHVAIASATLHRAAPDIVATVGTKLVPIGDCVVKRCQKIGHINRVLFVAPKSVIENKIIINDLKDADIEVALPNQLHWGLLEDRLKETLYKGKDFTASYQKWYARMIQDATIEFGPVDAVVLGSFELPLVYNEAALSSIEEIIRANDGRRFATIDPRAAQLAALAELYFSRS